MLEKFEVVSKITTEAGTKILIPCLLSDKAPDAAAQVSFWPETENIPQVTSFRYVNVLIFLCSAKLPSSSITDTGRKSV